MSVECPYPFFKFSVSILVNCASSEAAIIQIWVFVFEKRFKREVIRPYACWFLMHLLVDVRISLMHL